MSESKGAASGGVVQMSDTSASKRSDVASPCAACKINRKKCSDKCGLAPYFPQDDPQKFLSVNRVFGNKRLIKLLQDLPAEKRGDAVSSMVYEASERGRDPVHGCGGVIHDLQKKVAELQLQLQSKMVSTKLADSSSVGVINDLEKKIAELQSQLDSTQAELANLRLQHTNLLYSISTEGNYLESWGYSFCYEEGLDPNLYTAALQENGDTLMNPTVFDDVDPTQLWEVL